MPNSPDLTSLPTVTLHKSPPKGDLLIIQRSSVEVCGHDTTFPSFLEPQLESPDNTTVYENPLITATPRALISDIHALICRCCAVDVPRPLSILRTLLRVRPPNKFDSDPWFKAIRIWADVDDINETESFDDQRKSFVEYTLNILFFPDLHSTYRMPKTLSLRYIQPSPECQVPLSLPAAPSFSIPGTPLYVPSPLHFQLPVLTRLVFNEQGQITYHRDIWDFCDVVRLIPGVRMALWVMSRAGAWGLSCISQIICPVTGSDGPPDKIMSGDNGLLTSTAQSNVQGSGHNSLGVA